MVGGLGWLVVGWVGAGVGWVEAAAVGWCVGIDGVALLVDDDVVVEPAQQGEVGGVVGAVLGSGEDVVDFEAVAARAAVCGAGSVVAVVDVVAGALRYAVSIGAYPVQVVCGDEGGGGFAGTEDLFQCVGADRDPGLGDGPGFASGGGGVVGGDEAVGLQPALPHSRSGSRSGCVGGGVVLGHRGGGVVVSFLLLRWGIGVVCRGGGEVGVEGEGHQCVDAALFQSGSVGVVGRYQLVGSCIECVEEDVDVGAGEGDGAGSQGVIEVGLDPDATHVEGVVFLAGGHAALVGGEPPEL